MNAIQFIKEQGVDVAREAIEEASAYGGDYLNGKTLELSKYAPSVNAVFVPDLKRLVESVDLIGKYHSIDHAKNHYNNMREALNQYQYENKDIEDLSNELEQAIADYEAIHSDNDMGDDSHIENHVSPNCKVGVK